MAGLFDIFTNKNAQDAADSQIAGLKAGLNNASLDLTSYYGKASDALNNSTSLASGALTNYFGNAGSALSSNYLSALQPFLQNYGTAQRGVTGLQNLLGLNGPQGNAAAMTALQNTPGYQFQLQQGDNALTAQAAATGQLASGNTALALSKYNQGLAGTTYQNAVNNLMPFLNQSNTAAAGIGNIFTGLGSSLAGINTGLGTNLANLNTGLGQNLAGLNTNLGNSLANLNWQAATGEGNAQANADLANNTASANMWNALSAFGGAALNFAGGGGLSHLNNLAGNLSGGFTSFLSDARAKDDIEQVGELYDGTGVYRYRYKGDPRFQIGVMAQEVEQSRPDAITEIGGLKHVDYAKATDLAASLASFLDDGKVAPQKSSRDYASDLSRFLEAA